MSNKSRTRDENVSLTGAVENTEEMYRLFRKFLFIKYIYKIFNTFERMN